jgi:short-subunit dehydrogenase
MIILITGATAGIGRHLALALAALGHRVFATGRKKEALEALAVEARGQSFDLEVLLLDVTDPSSIDVAARSVLHLTGGRGVDVLINNAGYGQAGALLELSDQSLRDQFEVNVFGLMAVTRAFVPPMVERRGGTVINISSTGGRFTFPFFGAYHASKYAVEALSDALRMELSPFGVRVAIIEPGPVESSFADRTMTSLPSDERTKYPSTYAKAAALRGMSDRFSVGPELVAKAVVDAITSSRPRARYLVPSCRFHMLFMMLAVLPTRLIDALFRRAAGLRLSADF